MLSRKLRWSNIRPFKIHYPNDCETVFAASSILFPKAIRAHALDHLQGLLLKHNHQGDNMMPENKDSPGPHSPSVNRIKRFFEAMAIMSVTSLVVSTFEAIFLAPVDPRSWLHYILFISFYTMFYFLYEKIK
ncbi:hypothetical protein AnigIFM56816_008443 [Aspergillus niger]|nr:hypothetical protein AnigIFM56816_008443 [Aspergillus niger]